MKKEKLVRRIVNFYRRHPLFQFFSMYSFAVPILPVAVYYNEGYDGLLHMLLIYSPLWVLIFSVSTERKRLAVFSFIIYLMWGTIYAFLSFWYFEIAWLIYIPSVILSIFSAVNLVNS